MPQLTWLPQDPEWKSLLAQLPNGDLRWESLTALTNFKFDFLKTSLLDPRFVESSPELGPESLRLASNE
jgi:hypothetical protein